MIEHTDILVIGSGIAGTGLAAELSQNFKITILEREATAGYHSTSRSAAVFLNNYGNQVIRALSAEAFPIYQKMQPAILSPRGLLWLAELGEQQALDQCLSEGKELEPCPIEAICEMVPFLNPDKLQGGLYEAKATDIDVDLLHQSYMKTIKANDGQLRFNQKIKTIIQQDVQPHWVIETENVTYQASVIVNAAGAWADSIAEQSGITPLGIHPKRRSIAVLPPPIGYKEDMPLISSVTERWYAKPQAGKLLVSPAEEYDCAPHDAYVDDMILAEGLDRFQQVIKDEIARVEHSWAGLRSFAPDRSPVIGFHKDKAGKNTGFFWLAGQGGYGIQTAPAVNVRAAQEIKAFFDGTPYQGDSLTDALSPNRFA